MRGHIIAGFCALALCAAMPLSGCQAPGAAGASGTYTGRAKGHGGDVVVEVRIASGRIQDIRVAEDAETQGYGDRCIAELPGRIVHDQSLGVDVTSGATITSRAVFAAVADALGRAGIDPKTLGYTPVADISAKDVVTIVGLPQGDVEITGEQLRGYDAVTVEATSVSASGASKDLVAKGVKLETLLQSLGTSQKDYASIIATATDDYSIEIPDGVLRTRDIIIAYEVDGEPQSPRTIVPDERAMYWVKFLGRLELMGHSTAEEQPAREIVLLETAVRACKSEAYKHYDAVDEAVRISDLLAAFAPERSEFVTLQSTDRWGKNERYDTFAAQYIKYTGQDAPLFIGPSLPEGMRLKRTLSMRVGDVNIVSVDMGEIAAGVQGGLALSQLMEIANLREAEAYTLTGADGYRVDIAAADVAKGMLTTTTHDMDGTVTIGFEGLDESTTVNKLLRIRAK